MVPVINPTAPEAIVIFIIPQFVKVVVPEFMVNSFVPLNSTETKEILAFVVIATLEELNPVIVPPPLQVIVAPVEPGEAVAKLFQVIAPSICIRQLPLTAPRVKVAGKEAVP